MTKPEAIKILVAMACCSSPNLTCEDCPLYDMEENKCCSWMDSQIVEAVKVLKTEGE